MAKNKRRRNFLPYACGGGFAGFLLYLAIRQLAGEDFTWWMGVLLLLGCIALGVFLENLDKRGEKVDVVYRKKEATAEGESDQDRE